MIFFNSSKKSVKNLLLVKNPLLLNCKVLRMSLSCSGEQKEQFENPFEVLAQLEFEITFKNHAQGNFSGKIEKNHKSLGRDLKTQFLPKKSTFHWSVMVLETFWGVVQKIYF